MPLGFQDPLNNFQFERTVDWRVLFPGLYHLINTTGSYVDYSFFAKSVTLPTSFIEVEPDPYLVGFFQSKLVQPTLSVELFTDGNGKLEAALRAWNRAAFTNEGYMPSPSPGADYKQDSYPTQAVQTIKVCRINPVSLTEVKASFGNAGKTITGGLYFNNVLDCYTFRGYLSKLPAYDGSNSASIRTVSLTINVLSIQIALPEDAWKIEYDLADINRGRGWYSDIQQSAPPERRLNLYSNKKVPKGSGNPPYGVETSSINTLDKKHWPTKDVG